MALHTQRSMVRIPLYVVTLLALAFAYYLIDRISVWVALVAVVWVISLIWRGVHALERIATTMEQQGTLQREN